MKQLHLTPIIINEDAAGKLIAKQLQYNEAHPDEPLTVQETAKMLLEYAIDFLDISAIG